jgi:hypothetical protein
MHHGKPALRATGKLHAKRPTGLVRLVADVSLPLP